MKETPGLVDAHSHLRSTSLESHGVVGNSVGRNCLEDAILRMNAMTGVDPSDDAFVASCNLLLSGISSVQVIFHTFGTPDFYLEHLDKTINGIKKSGIRARMILAITDQYEFLPKSVSQDFSFPIFVNPGQRMTPELFTEVVQEARDRYPDIALGVGPVAPQWCSDSMMSAIGALSSEGLRVHTHFLESQRQRTWIDESPLERLMRFGLLHNKCSLAHSIWLRESDIDQIKESGAQLVTCPHSNQKLKSGKVNTAQWIEKEIPYAIGLDSIEVQQSPYAVALLSLTPKEAENALTTGGAMATDLPADHDRANWSDWQNGKLSDLSIDGRSVVSDGKLHCHAEYREVSAKIESVMEQDRSAREKRQSELSELMPSYLETIGAL